jgi:hypothetical protein
MPVDRVTSDPGGSRLHARLANWGCDPTRFSAERNGRLLLGRCNKLRQGVDRLFLCVAASDRRMGTRIVLSVATVRLDGDSTCEGPAFCSRLERFCNRALWRNDNFAVALQ